MEKFDIVIITTKAGYDFLAKRAEKLMVETVKKTGVTLVDDKMIDNMSILTTRVKPADYSEYGNTVVFGWEDIPWDHACDDVSAILGAIEDADKRGFPIEYAELGDEGTMSTFSLGDRDELCRHVSIACYIDVTEEK